MEETHIESYPRNGWQIIKVTKDIGMHSDSRALKYEIEQHLRTGPTNIAVSLTPLSFFFTKTIATLVHYHKLALSKGCRLAIIQSDERVIEILSRLGIDKIMHFFGSEEEVGGEVDQPGESDPNIKT